MRVIPLRLSTKLIVDFPDGKPMPRSCPPFAFGHWLEGYLEQDIAQSSRIWFEAPHIRNGRVVQDVWRSSRIYAVVGDQAWCERAKFRLLMVPPYPRQLPETYGDLAG